jgi:hypothetical protein
MSILLERESRGELHRSRAPLVEVMRPAVPRPLAANVEAGLEKTGVLKAL